MRSTRRITAALVAALAFVALTACTPSPNEELSPSASSAHPSQSAGQSGDVAAAFEALVDRAWQFDSGTVDGVELAPVNGAPTITLLVTRDDQGKFQLGGRTCNSWETPLADFPTGTVVQTTMSCAPELADLESTVTSAIINSTSVIEDAGTLTLRGDGIELHWIEQEPLDRSALLDVTWTLAKHGATGPDAPQVGTTWMLKSDGTFTASYDCFHLAGTWVEQGSEVRITDSQTDGQCAETERAWQLYDLFSGSFTTSFANGVLTTTSTWGDTSTHIPAG